MPPLADKLSWAKIDLCLLLPQERTNASAVGVPVECQ